MEGALQKRSLWLGSWRTRWARIDGSFLLIHKGPTSDTPVKVRVYLAHDHCALQASEDERDLVILGREPSVKPGQPDEWFQVELKAKDSADGMTWREAIQAANQARSVEETAPAFEVAAPGPMSRSIGVSAFSSFQGSAGAFQRSPIGSLVKNAADSFKARAHGFNSAVDLQQRSRTANAQALAAQKGTAAEDEFALLQEAEEADRAATEARHQEEIAAQQARVSQMRAAGGGQRRCGKQIFSNDVTAKICDDCHWRIGNRCILCDQYILSGAKPGCFCSGCGFGAKANRCTSCARYVLSGGATAQLCNSCGFGPKAQKCVGR